MVKKIIFVSDFSVREVPTGGAELVNDVLVNLLKEKGFTITEEKSHDLSVRYLKDNQHCFFIVANFTLMSPNVKTELASGKYSYVIYEHDHKYLPSRNPGQYKDFLVPKDVIINYDLYAAAKKIICQCQHHETIIKNNLELSNTCNIGASLWHPDFFEQIEDINISKTKDIAIVASNNPIKNQLGAEQFCMSKGLSYEIISSPTPTGLLEQMAAYKTIVYLPKVPESFSRLAVEAKMVGCKLISNKLLGCAYEPWFKESREDIILEMKNGPTKIYKIIEPLLEFKDPPKTKPITKGMVSIIVPTYNDAQYLRESLDDIVNQTYENIEVILVNDGSTDNTEEILKEYCSKYDTFRYYNKENGGTGDALNCGFREVRGEFLTWFSSDDRKEPQMVERLVNFLQNNRQSEYVFSAYKSDFFGRIIRAYLPANNKAGYLHNELHMLHDNLLTGKSFIVNDWVHINRKQCYQGVNFMFTKRLKDECGEFLNIPGEDYYMSVLMGLNSKVGYVDECLGTHRNPVDSLSMENRNCVQEANQRTWDLIDLNYNRYKLQ